MAKQTINIGASPNDGTGTPLRTAFDYTNQNFTELYTATGPSGNNIVVPGNATITGDLTVRTTGLILNTSGLGVGITPTSFGAGYGTIQVSGATGSGIKMGSPTNGSFIYSDNTWLNILTETNIPHRFFVNNIIQHTIEQLGVFSWKDGVGGTRMTLNATGLGVGTSPTEKLTVWGTSTVYGDSRFNVGLFDPTSATTGTGSGISMGGYTNGTTIGATFAQIKGIKENSTAGNIAGALVFSTLPNGGTPTERLRIDSFGNVGIGVTPSYKLQSVGIAAATSSTVNGSGGNLIGALLNSDDANSGVNPGVDLRRWTGTALIHGTTYIATNATGDTLFYNGTAASNTRATSLKMTLDASGNLLVGRTAALGGKIGAQVEGGNGAAYLLRHNGATAGKYRIFAIDASNNGLFYDQNNVGMYMADAGTAWIATSDETQKDIIEPISNAISKVGSLRAVIGKFKTDANSVRRSFLIAQDVQTALPEAVHQKDGLLGLSYTDVIPLLVAAIKELTAEVNALKNA